jgi:hypothetical protein
VCSLGQGWGFPSTLFWPREYWPRLKRNSDIENSVALKQ